MSNSGDDDGGDYEVGYGKPPKHTQFKKGQRSANPKGRRPKEDNNYARKLKAELEKPIYVKEDGRRKRTTKGDVTLKVMVNEALAGKRWAVEKLIKILPKLFELPKETDLQATAGGDTSKLSLSTLEALIRALQQQVQKLKAAEKSSDQDGSIDQRDHAQKDENNG